MLFNIFDFVNFRKRGSRERDRESDRARSHDRRLHRKPEREQRHLERPGGGGHKGQERPQVRVSVQGVKSLWGDCMFIPADWGS